MSKNTQKLIENFNSILEVTDYFSDEKICNEYLIQQRWNGHITCPHCSHEKVYKFSDNKRFKCAKCREQFTAKTDTIFEDTKIALRKWYIAIYLVINHKKGISSHQLARDIKVTQKTAWFMLHRIRFGLGFNADNTEMEGTIQLDESFVGGKNKNRHADKKVKNSQGRSFKDKTPVMGMLQEPIIAYVDRPHKVIEGKTVTERVVIQKAKVRCRVVPDTSTESLQPIIRKHIKENSILVSDEWMAYNGLGDKYDHRIIDHRAKEYVNANGDTTNAMEGFWTWLKRSYIGIYHNMSRKHLQNYVNEVEFRYNNIDMANGERLTHIISNPLGRLKYSKLTVKLEY